MIQSSDFGIKKEMLRIEIPLALFSENQAYRSISRGRFCSIILSKTARDFQNEFQKLTKPFRNEIKTFEALHDPTKQGIELSIVHKTPKYFTKKGTISENSIDCDNVKIMVDALFSNFEKLKDSQVIALHSYKMYAEKHSLILVLKSVDKALEVNL